MHSPIQRLASTVADPSAPAYIAAAMIVEAGPLLGANGRLRLTVIADTTIIPDVDRLFRGMASTWRSLARETVASV